MKENSKNNDVNRYDWIDLLKGFAAMMVILVHEPIKPSQYRLLVSFIMIPLFFFCSGYLTKFNKDIPMDYLYQRVLKLFIINCFYVIIGPFTSVSNLVNFYHNPLEIIKSLKDSLIAIVLGTTWFIPCLILVMILFLIINLICRGNYLLCFVISTIFALVTMGLSKRGMIYWSADTALVCQWFFFIGYLSKELNFLNKVKNIKVLFVTITVAYLLIIELFSYYKGIENVAINVAINKWGYVYITIIAILLGNFSIICFSLIVKHISMVNYIGKHSLIYFIFGYHGMSVAYKFLSFVILKIHFEILSNEYILTLLVCILGSLIMIIPCIIIDKFFPFLNGKFKMPEIKKELTS